MPMLFSTKRDIVVGWRKECKKWSKMKTKRTFSRTKSDSFVINIPRSEQWNSCTSRFIVIIRTSEFGRGRFLHDPPEEISDDLKQKTVISLDPKRNDRFISDES